MCTSPYGIMRVFQRFHAYRSASLVICHASVAFVLERAVSLLHSHGNHHFAILQCRMSNYMFPLCARRLSIETDSGRCTLKNLVVSFLLEY